MEFDLNTFYIIIGFLLAGYSIVANDSIQTLGVFLSSNEHKPWWVLWIFISVIFTVVLVYGYVAHSGDVSYGRLEKFPPPENFSWIYVLPPIAIFILTRYGIPVSTTFLVLTVFASWNFEKVLIKSVLGYIVAFLFAGVVYYLVSKLFEQKIYDETKNAIKEGKIAKDDVVEPKTYWVVLQWLSTAFLWSQWLIQDLANIYVYAPAQTVFYKIGIDINGDGKLKGEESVTQIVEAGVDPATLINPEIGEIFTYAGKGISLEWLVGSILMLWVLQGIMFYQRGGEIQKIVRVKTNTLDVRSATLINLIFGLTLMIFKEWSSIPMSTTWVFIGLLAGREIMMTFMMKHRTGGTMEAVKMATLDFSKILFGLVISIIIAFGIPWLDQMFFQ